ncbi:bifunctional RNase H/acid phosphatase [Corynebacterium glucuronolyticum]|uniref:bifunctional RNase H/acid phosphatase n=1 Tax=Corynebacterium glucuronolyticum TaxID=39791 RepID=UPI00019C1B0C|nr:bifunctional RNase H/acid phosphatase [Corynebacterium glucuronolyticum]EEI26968.1 ribonuclease HI [Corynebacterium glucuronolyticum ATCC 51867]QRO82853.1 bifunctional RNase H/acid phosphatase [Corynebacterium glucuronolyticum]
MLGVTVFADGGSRGNPGIAGSGSVVKDSHGNELRALSHFVGKTTNNVAEYQALINGLRAALELGATHCQVFMDSKLVVEQMSGRWKIKHPDMQAKAKIAHELINQFEQFSILWVPRKKNARADELANIAMDAGAQGAKPGFVGSAAPSVHPSDPKVAPSHPKDAEDTKDRQAAHAPANKDWVGATTEALTIYLVRHGQTEMSVKKQYSGSSDPALTELGRTQASRVATFFEGTNIDAVISSPQKRAQETARGIADMAGVAVHTDEALREVDFGTWEGLTFAEAHERDPELHAEWLDDPTIAPPDGESLDSVYRRSKRFVTKAQKTWAGKTIVVVSHVNPIKAIVRLTLRAPGKSVSRMHLDLASVSTVQFYADGPSLLTLFNSTAHLS